MPRLVALSLACFVFATAPCHVQAANKTWTAAVSGDFSDATRWTGGTPGSGDTATFNAAGTYTVTFDNSPLVLANPVLNQDLFFQAGNVTFTSGSGGPYTYRLTGAGGDDALITGGTLTLGTSGNPLHLTVDDDLVVRGGSTLNIRFGSDVDALSLFVANLASSNGTILVDGAGSTFDVSGTASAHNLGGASTGTMTFQNGATGTIAGTLNMAVSGSNTADAHLTVGAGSALTLTNLNIMTSSAPGTGQNAILDVRGTLTLSGTLTAGHANADASSDALINIATTGVLNTGTGNINVNKETLIDNVGAFFANGNITFTGGRYQESITFPSMGTFHLAAGKTLTVQAGSTFTADDVTFNENSVVVDGAGTSFGLFGAIIVANATGTSNVTVRNNASAGLGNLALGVNQASAVGNLNVQTGATVTASSITMGTTNVSGAAGNINVSGGSLTQVGTSTLTIGAIDTAATSTLSITGGTFSTATVNVTVNATGRIDVDGGTLNLRGNTTLDGGTLTRNNGTLNLTAGRTFTARNNAQINLGMFGSLSGDTTWNINSGADLIATSQLLIGSASGSTTSLTVDGVGSSLTVGSTGSQWGFVNSAAIVTIRNGATATLGLIELAASSINSTGTLNIQSGAAVTGSQIRVLPIGGAGSVGTVTVDGPGSSLVLSSSIDLGDAVGSPSGPATLNVTNGGTFTSGTGGTFVRATGVVNIDGGTADLKTLTVSPGGTINFAAGSLSYLGNLTVGTGGLLGENLTLGSNRRLTLSGTTTVDSGRELVLDGGTLSTGTLVVAPLGGSFVFNRGTLTVTQSGANINTRIVSNSPSATINVQAANVSLGDAGSILGFHHLGMLNVGSASVTLNSLGYARLGAATAVFGGTINAPNGIYLPGGGTLLGFGAVNARITGDAGALIIAQGALNMGDAASPAGFNFDGELRTQQQAVTLHSSAQAALGNLTTLGSGASPGTLNATNGFVADFGEAVTGFGTINSSNTLAKRAIINGTMQGNSAAQPITLTGYIKGDGAFDNVIFTGTFDPGLSPTLSTVSSVTFGPTNTLIMEIGGTARGSQYDAIIDSAALRLDGTLQVALIDSFNPSAGNSFDLLDWASLAGTFDTVQLPSLAGGFTWDTSQLYTAGVLAVISAGLAGDYNQNGVVDAGDYVVWRKSDGTQDGYNQWRANFGRTAVSSADVTAIGSTAVPEPATLVLVFIAVIAGFRRPRAA